MTISDPFIQYVLGPTILVMLAGIGWMVRYFLIEILHQVKNDHSSNLRDDMDELRAAQKDQAVAMQDHADADDKLALVVSEIRTTLKITTQQLVRMERRLNTHLDNRDK